MKTRLLLISLVLLAAMLACQAFPGGDAPAPLPPAVIPQVEAPQAAPQATPTGETLVLPLLQSGGGQAASLEALTAELAAQLNAGLPPTPTPDASGYTGGARTMVVFPLEVAAGAGVLWAASSSGTRSFEPDEPHYVSIYTHTENGWQELSRLVLAQHEYMMGASQVALPAQTDTGAWLEVSSGVGAHGGCYSLLYFDGQTLSAALENCNSTPPSGASQDLDGDGLPEIVLDATDYYVSCYACGVQLTRDSVWGWVDGQLVELALGRLPRPADPRLVELNDQAVLQAEADLWKEARETIHQAQALDGANPTVARNALLIDRAAGRRQKALEYTSSPLLSQVFYGDYAAAMEIIRAYPPEQIFSPATPLVGDDGLLDRSALGRWLEDFAGRASMVHYDRADIHFIQGWAAYLQNPADPQALSRVQIAAGYAPDDAFYAACKAFLEGQP